MGYTQEIVAEKLEIGRPRYSDIENGKRDIPLKDLYRFCEFFGRPLEYFLKESLKIENGFNVLFRKAEGDQEVFKVVTEFESLCEKMCELESIMEIGPKPSVSLDYKYDKSSKSRLNFFGNYYANEERRKLGLGLTPLKSLEQVLEEKYGIRIFYLSLPREKDIFGMFTFDEALGACILINTGSSRGKQLFSLAHEYAHFIFHKKRLGIISSEDQKDTSDERIADYFATEFLMPERSIVDIFNFRVRNTKDITAQDIIYMSDYFGVSFLAMLFRLNNLKLLRNHKKEELMRGTFVNRVRTAMGTPEPKRGRNKFPRLYVYLCKKAYEQSKVTTSKLAYFLEIPLYQAMELARQIKRSAQDDSTTPNDI